MKIAISSDHGGFELKEFVVRLLNDLGHEPLDLGCHSIEPVDYPDYASQVARRVLQGEAERGILICGTGLGMSIAANRFHGIRATLVNDLYLARMSREHTDSNILVLGGRVTAKGLAEEIVRVWLKTEFAGNRHSRRLEKIAAIEEDIPGNC
ncbi:MAG: ribose 5-phosphate isomerase B [Proteobacteria bacterium]|nr:ribose 5-phosphate isomerase B [Pseudomonadota bacterium]